MLSVTSTAFGWYNTCHIASDSSDAGTNHSIAKKGLPADFLNSTQSIEGQNFILRKAESGLIKILYIALKDSRITAFYISAINVL